jgi:hypothetical protein
MRVNAVRFTFTRAGDQLAGTLYLPPSAPSAAALPGSAALSPGRPR